MRTVKKEKDEPVYTPRRYWPETNYTIEMNGTIAGRHISRDRVCV